MVGNYNAANGHSAAEDPVIRDGTLGGVAPDVAELKAEHHHKEQISLNDEKDSSKGSETVKDDSHGYYHNFQPIANLGLADWRATERKLVRALDLTLMPTLWLTYLNNYLDRTNIAQAMLGGLDDDLGLSGQGYSTALSILTAGYMIGQLPSNMLLTRVRPSIYLPSVVVIWSIISACTALAKTPTQLFVIRFFLGTLNTIRNTIFLANLC